MGTGGAPARGGAGGVAEGKHSGGAGESWAPNATGVAGWGEGTAKPKVGGSRDGV